MKLALALTMLAACGYAATFNSDGSQSDVQSKINSASDGDTVTIPSGSFNWGSGVTISGKGIRLTGQGSGRIVARSTSSVTIGTGTKTFTTTSNGAPISPGQTLHIERTGGQITGGNPTSTRLWMEGTVNSYSAGSLEMDITSTAGSGTHVLWYIKTVPTTTVTKNYTGGTMLDISEDTTHHVEIDNILFSCNTTGDVIGWGPTSGGLPPLIHDCVFESGSSHTDDVFSISSNKGVIWNMDLIRLNFSMAALGVHHKAEGITTSWTTSHTMGAADTTGRNNLYFEDCVFQAWLNAVDCDDNTRSVYRRITFNGAGFGSHGADTSNYGVRHYEIYDSEFIFNGYADGTTFNQDQFVYARGGTFAVTDCVIPNMTSTDFGNKPEFDFTVMNLQRSGGPNPCYDDGYPCPRQLGMGRITGAAGNDSITYIGDSDPIYVWNNSGSYTIAFSDFGECGTQQTSDYVVEGRDYFNNGTARPSYTKYTYPHPDRASAGQSTTPAITRIALARIKARK